MIVRVRNIVSGVIFLIATLLLSTSVCGQAVEVEAGEPTTICYGSFVDLSTLGASISGAVDDGTWFSSGDGVFLPGNASFVAFSVGTFYQPGLQDLQNGMFDLILVSDDPDGIGPGVQVNDQVTITIMTAPALSCSGEINVSLDEQCTQVIDVQLLVPNPIAPVDLYVVSLYDDAGTLIPDNTLTNEHIGQLISYTVGHSCTANTCSGSITVSDNIAPFLNCIDAVVDCSGSTDPLAIGLPIPFFAIATAISPSSFTVTNLDGCGEVVLSYTDVETTMDCAEGLSSRIVRSWSAQDINGNTSSCTQTIDVEVLGLESVTIPPDYDNVEEDALECDGSWIALDNGHPSPESTGMPTFSGCTNMEATYTDILFDHCGAGFKVLRKWLIIDWCTTDHLDINQIIEVADTSAPVFECAADVTIGTDPYECASLPFEALFEQTVVDCSEWDYSIAVLDANNIDQSAAAVSGYTIQGLPTGLYSIVYTLADACGNTNTCTQQLEVIDDKTPFAICDQYTQVAVQSDGTARLFATSVDEASYDNCGVASMSIQRIEDTCGSGPSWGPYVDFCCEDVGDTVLVEFRVTDLGGLSNTCMVEVLVEDKIAPIIICPTDLTISCDYVYDPADLSVFGVVRDDLSAVEQIIINDNYNNGIAGSDGYFNDNCTAVLSETSTISTDCGQGLITRAFTVIDGDGNVDQCSQQITIVNDNPFVVSDITWPTNYSDIGCDTLQATPDITGSPAVSTDRCADVASTYHDQVFNLGGDACVKILRYWTVIDWCQYDSDTGLGIWEYIQEIKLLNDIAPTFVSCSDTSICEYESCDIHLLDLTVSAGDDCTAEEFLSYTWEIDLGADGLADASGSGPTISRVVPLGSHTVHWLVADGCGNTTTCTQAIAITDCKLPTPYCTAGIATTLMPSSGSLQIHAADFDLGSTDNCTAVDELLISFSDNILDTTLTLTCADIPNGVAAVVPLQMWVTDAAGNQDYCSIELVLQDNQDSCPDGDFSGRIAGAVRTWTDIQLEGVSVGYDTYVEDYGGEVQTNGDGVYAATDLPLYLGYGLKPIYEGGPKKDVNTIDLIAIQRHILGITEFDNPYDLIAADVTNNGKVQSSDLLILRKYILGILPAYPQAPKWKFVPEAYVFADVEDPFGFEDSLQINYLTEPVDTLDWVAVRMGNVNGIFTMVGQKNQSESRNQQSTDLLISSTQLADGTYISELQLSKSTMLDGLQLSLEDVDGEVVGAHSSTIPEQEYAIVDGRLHIAHTDLGGQLSADATLLSIKHTTAHLQLSTQIEPIVIGEEISTIELIHSTGHVVGAPVDLSIKLLSQPVSSDILFEVQQTTQEPVQIAIYSISGQLLHRAEYSTMDVVRVPGAVLPSAGVYVLRVDNGSQSVTEQLVKI